VALALVTAICAPQMEEIPIVAVANRCQQQSLGIPVTLFFFEGLITNGRL
jgi:hypothetical protein